MEAESVRVLVGLESAALAGSLRTMILGLLIAFGVVALLGPWFIRALRRMNVGQNVNELAPESHQKKQGTPTMGGLLFAGVSVLLSFLLRTGPFALSSDLLLAVSLFALLNLVIGVLDDLAKLHGKQNKGLSERQKLIAQCAVALLFSVYCYVHPLIGSSVVVPFFGVEWQLGPFYIPVMMFVIICTTNGANLLDGLDGLLSGVTSVIAVFFTLVIVMALGLLAGAADAYANLQNIGTFCAVLCGALLGFLAYNVHPARMIMGDTGSMYLGGVVAAVAMVTRLPLLIPLVAGAYAASLLSVFTQRWYFRLTGGKRIFRMSPLHHHFELTGVKETKIASMYVIVTVVLCLIALIGIV